MRQLKKSQKFPKILLAFVTLALVVIMPVSQAQDVPTPPADPTSTQAAPPQSAPNPASTSQKEPAGFCEAEMMGFIQQKTKELGDFMTQHFRSGDQTSELLPDAMQKFREHAQSLKSKLTDIYPHASDQGGKVFQDYESCRRRVNDALFIAKELLKQHILATAHGKKTTKLLDGLKQINEKLDRLNFQTAQMYGNILTFSQKLPCYVETCN